MNYVGTVYRPPSEASSFILQVTVGCSHNRCTFCSMYKGKQFCIRTLEEIKEDVEQASRVLGQVKRVFLADGNVLCLPADLLIAIVQHLYQVWPGLERVSSYAGPQDLLRKSLEELKQIQAAGLTMLYLGVESGSDLVLKAINKGVTAPEMIQAGRRAVEAGFLLSCTVILGLGGKQRSLTHAQETAKVISSIDPHYVGALTLYLDGDTPLATQVREGAFQLLTPYETIAELRQIIAQVRVSDCLWRSNHVTNYLPIGGRLMADQHAMLKRMDDFLAHPETPKLGFKHLPTI